jgi:hypothetical protein
MRTEKELRDKKKDLSNLLVLLEKYEIYVSNNVKVNIKGQISNITWLLGEVENERNSKK